MFTRTLLSSDFAVPIISSALQIPFPIIPAIMAFAILPHPINPNFILSPPMFYISSVYFLISDAFVDFFIFHTCLIQHKFCNLAIRTSLHCKQQRFSLVALRETFVNSTNKLYIVCFWFYISIYCYIPHGSTFGT